MPDTTHLLIQHALVLRGDDTMMKGDFHEIVVAGKIMAVDKKLWSSWTGHRFLNGEVYHGPVYNMVDQSRYEGNRLCTCDTCQPTFKKNVN